MLPPVDFAPVLGTSAGWAFGVQGVLAIRDADRQ